MLKPQAGKQLMWRSFVADTIALISFFTVTGVVNERLVAGLAWEQVLDARVSGAILMVLSGRPYGLWRDRFMRLATETRGSQILWDTLALVSFQVPLYAVVLVISGASIDQVLRGSLGVIIIMLALGRPYGAYLSFIRGSFGLTYEAQKTMSLNV